MASQLKIDAARANGAKSHGPKTPEGREKSSANALKHGAFAKTMVLSNECPEVLAKMHQAYIDKFQPADSVERNLVAEMVAAKWRQFRVWAVETAILDVEMDRQSKNIAQEFGTIDQTARMALAFEALSGNSKPLSTFGRCEARFGLQFSRALKILLELRQSKFVSGNPPTTPPPADCKKEPKLDSAPEPQVPAPLLAQHRLQNEPNGPVLTASAVTSLPPVGTGWRSEKQPPSKHEAIVNYMRQFTAVPNLGPITAELYNDGKFLYAGAHAGTRRVFSGLQTNRA